MDLVRGFSAKDTLVLVDFNPKPSTLYPQTYTLHPRLDPLYEPSTHHPSKINSKTPQPPKPETLNPKTLAPQSLNPKTLKFKAPKP